MIQRDIEYDKNTGYPPEPSVYNQMNEVLTNELNTLLINYTDCKKLEEENGQDNDRDMAEYHNNLAGDLWNQISLVQRLIESHNKINGK
jgi:hypothetical protein